jgi:hypothetical protein
MQFEGSARFNFKETIWNNIYGAPLKCQIFAWLAALGKCNTADCPMKKGWPHDISFLLCLSEPDSALHLLVTCNVTRRMWEKILVTAQLRNSLTPTHNKENLQFWLTADSQLVQPAAKR